MPEGHAQLCGKVKIAASSRNDNVSRPFWSGLGSRLAPVMLPGAYLQRGLYPWWHWLLERKPRTLQVCTLTTSRGANLEPRPLKNSRETLSLQLRRLYDARRAGHGLLA